MDSQWEFKPDKKFRDWIDSAMSKQAGMTMDRLEKEAEALILMGYEPHELTIRSFPNGSQDVVPSVLVE